MRGRGLGGVSANLELEGSIRKAFCEDDGAGIVTLESRRDRVVTTGVKPSSAQNLGSGMFLVHQRHVRRGVVV